MRSKGKRFSEDPLISSTLVLAAVCALTWAMKRRFQGKLNSKKPKYKV